MPDRTQRRSITAAARGYDLEDVGRGLPKPDEVEGQLELPEPDAGDER
jgi:hypothetical protein